MRLQEASAMCCYPSHIFLLTLLGVPSLQQRTLCLPFDPTVVP